MGLTTSSTSPRASPGSGVPRSSSRFPARLSSRSPELLCPASAWASRRTKSLGTRPHPRCEASSLDSPLPRSLVSPIQTPRFPSPSPVPSTPSGHRSPAPAPPGGMTDSSCAESVLRPQGSENQSGGRELSGLPTGPPTPPPCPSLCFSPASCPRRRGTGTRGCRTGQPHSRPGPWVEEGAGAELRIPQPDPGSSSPPLHGEAKARNVAHAIFLSSQPWRDTHRLPRWLKSPRLKWRQP